MSCQKDITLHKTKANCLLIKWFCFKKKFSMRREVFDNNV
ncbi:hypothetical protein HMPREF9441_01849 [Paraprevotella clara YIT 11840]|uniref:Uncharacterized protein n=1 Tax=Paraprevotella clara YIT 11840 TaxID=762968 RepID=G5SR59_9BACT|nr:hypothetical protein HMPREF9441_01849 [Paraprevotella clara YIT 11840]